MISLRLFLVRTSLERGTHLMQVIVEKALR
jgi:hypothetical protein